MRRLAPAAAAMLVLGACGNLGADTPVCEPEFGVPVSIVLTAQAVPTAAYGPCINELKVGWTFEPLVAESGRARFSIDSDRLGSFLDVTLTAACDPGAAHLREERPDGIQVFVDTRDQTTAPVQLTLVPLTEDDTRTATRLAGTLSGLTLRDRAVMTSISAPTSPARTRAEEASRAGEHAIVVGDGAPNSMVLFLAGEPLAPRTVDVEEALDEIEDRLDEARYRATWYHVFDGGCIVYDIDASGPGVAAVQQEVGAALGFFPLAELRSQVEIASLAPLPR